MTLSSALADTTDDSFGVLLHSSGSFSFKCHRVDNTIVHSINTINFHPVYGTFITGGSDGALYTWDKVRARSPRAQD